jgi:hypothetical protein
MLRLQTALLLILPTFLSACPGDGNDDTGPANTSSSASSSSTTGIATTEEESATLIMGSTSMPEPTTGEESTGDTTGGTTETAVECGQPAETCDRENREWCPDLLTLCEASGLDLSDMGGTNYCALLDAQCNVGIPPCDLCFYLANTCGQLGTGVDCDTVTAECLCRAVKHELTVDF